MSSPSLRRHRPDLGVVVALVAAVAVAGLAMTAGDVFSPAPLGDLPMVAAFLLLLLVVVAALPPRWIARTGGGTVNALWPLLLSLAALVPVGVSLWSAACTVAIVEAARRTPLQRIVFASGRTTVSLGAAVLLIRAMSTWGAGRGESVWVLVMVAAAIVAVALDTGITAVGIALSRDQSILGTATAAVTVPLGLDVVLASMAPVLVVAAYSAPALLPVVLAAIAALVRTSSESLRHRHHAVHDGLTGLANRRAFGEHAVLALRSARRRGRGIAVVAIDLDRFKQVNDRYGHHAGDRVLQMLGERLAGAAREGDLVARVGGDEFTVLLPRLADPVQAEVAARRIVAALSAPLVLDGVTMDVGASAGVALFPDDGPSLTEVLAAADRAMYRAKSQGGGVAMASPTRSMAHPLIADLQAALTRGRLEVVFQPKVRLRDGRVMGAEALLRWDHPRLGPIPPSRFLGDAERAGLMDELTEYVVDRSVAEAGRWLAQGRHGTVSVNVRGEALARRAFAHEVRAVLQRHGVPGEVLQFEVAERSLLGAPASVTKTLRALRSMGVQVLAADVGPAGLGVLAGRSLPLDGVKVDGGVVGAMVSDPEQAGVAQSVIDLAHRSGLPAVAERVEDSTTLDLLIALGCDEAQGFLLGMPNTGDAILARLGSAAALGEPDAS